MRMKKFLQLQKELQELKNKEFDLDDVLILVEKLLFFSEELVRDIKKLETETKRIEKVQKMLENENIHILDRLHKLIDLADSQPEEALLFLRSLKRGGKNDDRPLN